uniref:Ig-like domain-containing protein n=1 Tax=Amphiprion percula TaxID=161767 RepID=A0A3P8SRU1_AMPPE
CFSTSCSLSRLTQNSSCSSLIWGDVLMSLEGDSVTLSCNYSGSTNYLYWYQQKSSSSPQLLMTAYSEKTEKLAVRHDRQSKELHLNISSAAVSDSAVYYCALEPTVTGNSKTLYKNTDKLLEEINNISNLKKTRNLHF